MILPNFFKSLFVAALIMAMAACTPTPPTSVPPQPMPKSEPAPPISLQVSKADKYAVPRPSDAMMHEILRAIDETNALRQAQGLPPLRYDDRLTAYAMVRASELVTKFSHERPNGELYHTEMSIGWLVGENIAAGKATPEETVAQWRDSPKHYHTMMEAGFSKVGIGQAYVPDSKYRYYWVQIFGADNTDTPYHF